nr:hypothetical protein [uncultured Desulfobacter sp.]
MFSPNDPDQLTQEISGPVRKLLAFIFLIVCLLLVLGTFFSENKGEFGGLIAIVGIPLFLLSMGLLFAKKRERQRGLFSGNTLFILGCLLIVGTFFIKEVGFLERSILVSFSAACFILAKKRWQLNKKNRKWFI